MYEGQDHKIFNHSVYAGCHMTKFGEQVSRIPVCAEITSVNYCLMKLYLNLLKCPFRIASAVKKKLGVNLKTLNAAVVVSPYC